MHFFFFFFIDVFICCQYGVSDLITDFGYCFVLFRVVLSGVGDGHYILKRYVVRESLTSSA